MTGPRPAGRPWTFTDDDQLRAMLKSGVKAAAIAQKLKRSIGAIRRERAISKSLENGLPLAANLPSLSGGFGR